MLKGGKNHKDYRLRNAHATTTKFINIVLATELNKKAAIVFTQESVIFIATSDFFKQLFSFYHNQLLGIAIINSFLY
jgi:hypothetical protein